MEENDFKQLMELSKLEIQFPDFEEKVMESILKEEAHKKSVWRNIRWSWFFFVCGLGLGLVLSNVLAQFDTQYFGGNTKLILYSIEILIVVILSFQFDNLVRITFGRKN